jgi:hypothetical protein
MLSPLNNEQQLRKAQTLCLISQVWLSVDDLIAILEHDRDA